MLQYKLLEILDKNTYKELENIFGSNNIFKFTDNIVGIKYDYRNVSYADVLKSVVGLNLRQWTMTSSRFLDIIDFSIGNNLNLGPIDFLEFIDDSHIEKIRNSIVEINMAYEKCDKVELKEHLIKNLEWIMLDECIDIKSIVISFTITSPPFNVETRFFNNGVLFVEEEDTLESLKILFQAAFSGDKL